MQSIPVEGYPKLASHMGRYPRCSIYRRFGALNSRNLLYMQAELIHLEKKLGLLEATDLVAAEGERRNFSRDWFWLNDSASEDNSEQLETVLAIRDKLKEYNAALMQQSAVSYLVDPDPHDLRCLQDWLERPAFGNRHLLGIDRDVWGATDSPLDLGRQDLLAVSPNRDREIFSIWLSQRFIPWFHRRFWYRIRRATDLENGIVSYEDSSLHKITSHLTTTLASLLPTLAIVVLYFVEQIGVRLGLVTFFTWLLAICLSYFTSVQRGEIFIATSTFAAVQVVFISSGT